MLLNHEKKNNSGCKPYDLVLMFKIILFKRFYNMSNEQAEYQINYRLSFCEFLGLSSGGRVPDVHTIWLFQKRLIQNNPEEILFLQFRNHLESLGLLVNEGKIVDASFVEVPRQRNSSEENDKIKSGEGDDLWAERKKSQLTSLFKSLINNKSILLRYQNNILKIYNAKIANDNY